MSELHGMENLKKVLLSSAKLGNVVSAIVEAVKRKDSWNLVMASALPLFGDLAGLASVDFKLLDDEYKDLSPEERKELSMAFKEKFDLEDDKAESAVELAIDLLIKLDGMVHAGLDLAKMFK